jgi:hypothetical protein
MPPVSGKASSTSCAMVIPTLLFVPTADSLYDVPPRWISTRPNFASSSSLGLRCQRTRYNLRRISIRTATCQPEQGACAGRQNIYAAQEVAHSRAKGRLVVLIQCVQESVAQNRGGSLSDRGGNEVHGVLLASVTAHVRRRDAAARRVALLQRSASQRQAIQSGRNASWHYRNNVLFRVLQLIESPASCRALRPSGPA